MRNGVTIGFMLSLMILFSTLPYFHLDGLYTQNLKNRNAATSVSNEALVQAMPYSIYATMIAEDDINSSRLIHDVSILPSY
jgi:hypothetical protein